VVLQDEASIEAFQAAHQVNVVSRALNLEEMFPLLVREQES